MDGWLLLLQLLPEEVLIQAVHEVCASSPRPGHADIDFVD